MTTSGTQRNWTRRATQCQCHCFLWSLWILSQRPWLKHGSWLTRICLTFIDILHLKLESRRRRTKGSVVGEEWCQNAAPLRWYTKNVFAQSKMIFLSRAWLHDTVSCAAWNDARKGVYLKPLLNPCSNCYWGWSIPIMLDYRDLSLMESVPLMWGPVTASPVGIEPMTILEDGPPPYNSYPIHNGENSMNCTGWPPNTPYDCAEARRTQVADATFRDLTSEASLWHSMLCPFTASVARGLLLTFSYFLHLLTTENHLPTGTFMNFDELSSFCQPHLKTTLRYSAKSVRLGGNDLIQIGPIRWLHHDAGTQRNWTRRATQCQCHCFLWSLGFFRRGPDSDMALDSHGFVWHLLTFYIGSFPLTFHALSLHGKRGSRPTSYMFLHLLTENHLPTGTFMNFDEISSFCQPRLKTTLRYSAKSVRLGGYDLIQIGSIRS